MVLVVDPAAAARVGTIDAKPTMSATDVAPRANTFVKTVRTVRTPTSLPRKKCIFRPSLSIKSDRSRRGQTKILRSDYKIGRYVPFVSDEITLYLSVEGIKE